MKKSKEELTRIHKEKCRELKEIRAKMAENLGIELHQRECTYTGYCRGTCPACQKEEMLLNAALLKKQMEGANLKGKVAAAGLATAAALCLTGCNTHDVNEIDGDISFADDAFSDEQLEGEPQVEVTDGEIGGFITPETSEGNMLPLDESEENYDVPGEYVELEGDVAYLPETEEAD